MLFIAFTYVSFNTFVLILAFQHVTFALFYYILLNFTSFCSLGKLWKKQIQQ